MGNRPMSDNDVPWKNDQLIPYGTLESDDLQFLGSSPIAASLESLQVPFWLYTGENADHILSSLPFGKNMDEIDMFIKRAVLDSEKVFMRTSETYKDGDITVGGYYQEKTGLTDEQIERLLEQVFGE